MSFSSRKDGDVESSIHLPGSIGMGRGYTNVSVVGVDVQGGIVLGRRGPAPEFGSMHLRLRCLVVGPRGIRTLQVNLKGQWSQRLVGSFLSQEELLARRQADDSS